MGVFLPGQELARAFYDETIAPLLGDVRHSAALLGTGSDVLGFDTKRSTDHGWGPRLQLFVERDAVVHVLERVERALPTEFRGWPTRFGWDDVPITHHVEVTELGSWLSERLGFDPRQRVGLLDWLATPQQLLLEVTGGAVFHDGLDQLGPVRARLEWYPDDVWRWLIGCQWRRLDQEEPFVGRTAEVGDELGSRVLAARLARDVIRLCFLFERRYAPYSKWLGTAFNRLDGYEDVREALSRAVSAKVFSIREEALVEAFRLVAARHNALAITEAVSEEVGLFHGRPFRVLGSRRFVSACLAGVADDTLRGLPLVGAIDQFVDSTDVLSHAACARRARAVYGLVDES